MAQAMTYAGWGDPARRPGIPEHARRWLEQQLSPGVRGVPVPLAAVQVAPSALSSTLRAALVELIGEGHVLDDHDSRVVHAGGKSYLDLLRMRAGAVEAPDAVLLPGSDREVAAILRLCAECALAVVPFGGGTSVVGGVAAQRGRADAVVSLDLRRLNRLISVDEQSLTAVLEPGLRGPAAESLLNERGLTLGHFPQSHEHASIGGYAATRSAGQASTGYGRFDELVVSAVLQTPAGELRVGRGAPSAAGPDLLALMLGSEGAFGVFTELELRVRRRPATQRFEGFFFRTWEEGCAALRTLEQSGTAPDVTRLSDPAETRAQLALAGSGGVRGRLGRAALALRGYRPGCLAILGWDGTSPSVRARRAAAVSVLRGHRAQHVGTSVGNRWAHGRYDAPYLRDDLLDAGVLVETLETSARWSALSASRQAVRTAVHESVPGAIVMCHVSHLYAHGASLYFTVLAGRCDSDPIGQWQRAKDAASAALVAGGATITHHHGVGTEHRPYMAEEIGDLGVEVLRAVKSVLDPTGALNPGKLIP